MSKGEVEKGGGGQLGVESFGTRRGPHKGGLNRVEVACLEGGKEGGGVATPRLGLLPAGAGQG